MKRITAIIIDDEKGGRNYFSNLLKENCPQVELIGVADSMKSGVELLNNKNPDILFLDIELPGGSGFKLLERLRSINFQLIFTTAYSEYAHRAFRYAAVDYLLKPVEIDLLKEAIQKATEQRSNQSLDERLAVMLHNMGSTKAKKIILPKNGGYEVVNLEDIVHCKAEGNYTQVYLQNEQKILVSKNMKEIEEMLVSDLFFRTHQSYLVNLQFVIRFTKGKWGEIELSNGSVVPLARSKKQEFVTALELN